MLHSMLKAKIHRARVTDSNLDYEGSLSVDRNLLAAAGLVPFERISVYNINNGERFETYIIEGEPGVIGLNGAAARKGLTGDLIIIAAYVLVSDAELATHRPTILLLDEHNGITNQLDE